MRVQIPAYADRWTRGDIYGEVLNTGRLLLRGADGKHYHPSDNELGKSGDTYIVKLDKSGRTIDVLADDCTEV